MSHWTAEPNEICRDQSTGIVYIPAKALNITWGNDDRFWKWVEISGSEHDHYFKTGAELVQVNWMEVTGTLELSKLNPSHHKTYEIVYVIRFKADAFGWHQAPITFEVVDQDGHKKKRTEMLEAYREKDQKRHEIHGGEFKLQGNREEGGKVVHFGMLEVGTSWWKGGMVVEGVLVRPTMSG